MNNCALSLLCVSRGDPKEPRLSAFVVTLFLPGVKENEIFEVGSRQALCGKSRTLTGRRSSGREFLAFSPTKFRWRTFLETADNPADIHNFGPAVIEVTSTLLPERPL